MNMTPQAMIEVKGRNKVWGRAWWVPGKDEDVNGRGASVSWHAV